MLFPYFCRPPSFAAWDDGAPRLSLASHNFLDTNFTSVISHTDPIRQLWPDFSFFFMFAFKPILRTGKALKVSKYESYPTSSEESSSSSDSDSDIEDRRPTKKPCTSEPSSLATHLSDTPNLNTHLAGSTPANRMPLPMDSFGSDVSQIEPSFEPATASTVLVSPRASQVCLGIPPTAVFNSEVLDILEGYNDYEEALEYRPTNSPTLLPLSTATASEIVTGISNFETTNVVEATAGNTEAESSHPGPTAPSLEVPTASPLATASQDVPTWPSPLPPTRIPPEAPETELTRLTSPTSSSHLERTAAHKAPPGLEIAPSLPSHAFPPPEHTMNDSFMFTQNDNPVAQRRIPGPAGQLPPLKTAEQLQNLVHLQASQCAQTREITSTSNNFPATQRKTLPPRNSSTSDQRSSHAKKIEDQTDFKTSSWASMLCDLDLEPYGSNKLATSLYSLRQGGWKSVIPSLIVYVKSFRLVEEDYRAQLRDPTGTLEQCTISRQVAESFPDFSIGCTMSLQNVPVFTPRKGVHHLLITEEKVIRVWPKSEMSREELSSLRASVYTYDCIYDPSAKPKQPTKPTSRIQHTQPDAATSSGTPIRSIQLQPITSHTPQMDAATNFNTSMDWRSKDNEGRAVSSMPSEQNQIARFRRDR